MNSILRSAYFPYLLCLSLSAVAGGNCDAQVAGESSRALTGIHRRTMLNADSPFPYRIKACEKLAADGGDLACSALIDALADEPLGFWAASGLWKVRESRVDSLVERIEAAADNHAADRIRQARVRLAAMIVQSEREPLSTLGQIAQSDDSTLSFAAAEMLAAIARADASLANRVAGRLQLIAEQSPLEFARLHAAWILANEFELMPHLVAKVESVFRDEAASPATRAGALAILTAGHKVSHDLLPRIVDAVGHPEPALQLAAVRCLGKSSSDPSHVSVLLKVLDMAAVRGDGVLMNEAVGAADQIAARIQHFQVRQRLRQQIDADQSRRQDKLAELQAMIDGNQLRNIERAYSNPFD
jgi:hypothetical protein